MSHREVMQQALEAIRIFREWETGQDYESCRATVLARALAAEESLGAALAEPEQEPVAWAVNGGFFYFNKEDAVKRSEKEGGAKFWPLYTHPVPQRQPQEPVIDGYPLWSGMPQRQPLTDEEIDRVTDAQWAANNHKPVYAAHRAFARAIEAAHGIKEEQK